MDLEVSRLKALLGIESGDISKDAILEFILDDVQEIILNYCHIKRLPDGLRSTAYRMAMDLYAYDNIGSCGATESTGDGSVSGAVSSITEGDVTVSFNTALQAKSAEAYQASVLKAYTSQLERYRKLVW